MGVVCFYLKRIIYICRIINQLKKRRMKKIKLSTLVNSQSALKNLIAQNLPIGMAWELKKFIGKINPEIVAFEQLKNEKIIAYGEDVIEGEKKTGAVRVKEENVPVYLEEVNEILQKEIDVDLPEIKMDEIIKYNEKLSKPAEMSIQDLMTLDWLIV